MKYIIPRKIFEINHNEMYVIKKVFNKTWNIILKKRIRRIVYHGNVLFCNNKRLISSVFNKNMRYVIKLVLYVLKLWLVGIGLKLRLRRCTFQDKVKYRYLCLRLLKAHITILHLYNLVKFMPYRYIRRKRRKKKKDIYKSLQIINTRDKYFREFENNYDNYNELSKITIKRRRVKYKRTIRFYSLSKKSLVIYTKIIKMLRWPDTYTGKGFRYSFDKVKIKRGKIRK